MYCSTSPRLFQLCWLWPGGQEPGQQYRLMWVRLSTFRPGPVVVDLHVRGHSIRLSWVGSTCGLLLDGARAADLLMNTLPVWDLCFLLFFPSLSVWTAPASSQSPCSHVIVLAGGNAACCVIDGVPSVTLAASTHSNPPTLFTLLSEAAFALCFLGSPFPSFSGAFFKSLPFPAEVLVG